MTGEVASRHCPAVMQMSVSSGKVYRSLSGVDCFVTHAMLTSFNYLIHFVLRKTLLFYCINNTLTLFSLFEVTCTFTVSISQILKAKSAFSITNGIRFS